MVNHREGGSGDMSWLTSMRSGELLAARQALDSNTSCDTRVPMARWLFLQNVGGDAQVARKDVAVSTRPTLDPVDEG